MEDLRIYNTIDSTNVEAHRLLTNPSTIAHGTTLVAHAQTAGKGQLGRYWHSSPREHLAMTIILKPASSDLAQLPSLSMLISLAIAYALEQTDSDLHPQIKWPNDIYLKGKKAGGILIENAIAGNRLQHVIAGFGLNVNETQFPPELPNAISMKISTGRIYDIMDLVAAIRSSVMHQIELPDVDWKEAYRKRMFGLQKTFDFDHKGIVMQGEVHDVDVEGRLVVRENDHALHAYYTHEIKWII